MEIRAISVFWLLVAFSVCKGLVLVGEEKRQGLIPFPRVGRTPSTSAWLQSFPSYFPSELDSDFDGLVGPGADDDLLAVRFTRGLFTPRLGRRKRSPDVNMSPMSDVTSDSDSSDGRHVRAAATSRIPRYLYDADGNPVDVRNLLRRSPWAIIAYKDGMEKKMAFNPRLGRAMVPRLGRKRSSDSDDEEDDAASAAAASAPDEKRAMAFSPRLGRGGGSGSQVRGGRAFSPRLGRSDVASETAVDNQQPSA